MKWEWLPFAELTAKQVYDMLQLREAVFQLEQKLYCRDIDSIDTQARHLLGYDGESLIAYLRIYMQSDQLIVGRVLVAKPYRGNGLAKVMLKLTLKKLCEDYPGFPILVSSQAHMTSFYQQLGFQVIGQPYQEAGITHIKMRYGVVKQAVNA